MNKTVIGGYHTLMRKYLIQYGLSSCKRPPPLSDHGHLTFCVVAYARFDCINSLSRVTGTTLGVASVTKCLD